MSTPEQLQSSAKGHGGCLDEPLKLLDVEIGKLPRARTQKGGGKE